MYEPWRLGPLALKMFMLGAQLVLSALRTLCKSTERGLSGARGGLGSHELACAWFTSIEIEEKAQTRSTHREDVLEELNVL